MMQPIEYDTIEAAGAEVILARLAGQSMTNTLLNMLHVLMEVELAHRSGEIPGSPIGGRKEILLITEPSITELWQAAAFLHDVTGDLTSHLAAMEFCLELFQACLEEIKFRGEPEDGDTIH